MSAESDGKKFIEALLGATTTGPNDDRPVPGSGVVAVYSPAAMVQLLIDNPNWTHKQYAAHFGRSTGWFAGVLASDKFQLALDPRRDEVIDPTITATLEERFRGLTLRSLTVLQHKMDSAGVADETVIKALEMGSKALGFGQKKRDEDNKPPVEALETLAERLTALMSGKRDVPAQPITTIEAQLVERKAPDGMS